jgi:hypothetical protein
MNAPTAGAGEPMFREMYVGLGAALENLTLAAWANGYRPSVTLMPAGGKGTHAARVALTPVTPRVEALYRRIHQRHANRYPYADRDVPKEAFAAMAGLAAPATGGPDGDLGGDVTVLWFSAPADRRRIGELMIAATEAFIADPGQIGTDYQWFRQDWDAIQRRRDGITVDAAGLAGFTAAMAKLLPAQSREATAKSWLSAVRDRHTATARPYGIVAVRDAADNAQRIRGGRLLERIHLRVTGHGLAPHHMNQITEWADRERQLGLEPRFGDAISAFVPGGWQALSTFRLGYPTHVPNRSPRRQIEDVIVTARSSCPFLAPPIQKESRPCCPTPPTSSWSGPARPASPSPSH